MKRYRLTRLSRKYEEIEKPLACVKKSDMNKAPWSGRLIRPWLAGFEVTGDIIGFGFMGS
jgi:hypothetical protein